MKKAKVQTPAWILEGYDSPSEYNKAKGIKDSGTGSQGLSSKKQEQKKNGSGKTFKVRECPKCKSDEVGVVLSNTCDDSETLESEVPHGSSKSQTKEWECRKCKWKGKDIVEKQLTEEEFMKYLDEKGEEVA